MKTEKTSEKRGVQDFIYLTACMLNAVAPEKSRLEVMDLLKVYKLAKRHMLASAIYLSIEQGNCLMYLEDALAAEWRMYTDAVIRKNILMDVERTNLLNRFESEAIWYVPLKGCIIANYYPDFGMREMADNDILFDATCHEKVRDIMVERGYCVEAYKESNQDVYLKEPSYNFEMHKDLMNKFSYPKFFAYYENIKDCLIKDENNNYGWHFSDEDFYIFFIVHAYKHYEFGGGTGVRTLADAYILNKRFVYEKTYIRQELKKLGIYKFEKEFAGLADKVFRQPEAIYKIDKHVHLSIEERDMLDYVIGAGVFGTRNNAMRNQLVRDGECERIHFLTRIRYILHRLYPKGEGFRERYPFFYKHVWAYIFLPVYRLARRGNIKSLIREAKLALKIR